MIWIAVGVAAGILVLLLVQYNKLIYLRQLTRNAWSDVDVYLKRRSDLIPNLVNAVKGYASHERTVLEALTEARSRAAAAGEQAQERAIAEGLVQASVIHALALAENYPDLKASENFLNLQRELSETEKLIASARQYYNACVRDYNTATEAFPSNLVATPMGLKPAEFFEPDSAAERMNPAIQM